MEGKPPKQHQPQCGDLILSPEPKLYKVLLRDLLYLVELHKCKCLEEVMCERKGIVGIKIELLVPILPKKGKKVGFKEKVLVLDCLR